MSNSKTKESTEWLNEAVFYQIYPQSYYDSNGDGIGDFQGIIQKLDYIKSLGVNALWINPCFESPFRDAGYDVSNYYKVAPRYGTNDDLKELFAEAKKRGIRILLDLVAGHTSTEHKWFKESSKDEKNKYSDWYVWTNNALDQTWGMSFIGGITERNGQFSNNYYAFQAALNYVITDPDPKRTWQQGVDAPGPKAVVAELKNIIRYWLDMGASGYRVDMAFSLVKSIMGEKFKGKHLKESLAIWQGIRNMLDEEYPEAVIISECFKPTMAIEGGFHSDFSFHFWLRNFFNLGKNLAHGDLLDGSIPTTYLPPYEEIQKHINCVNENKKGYISLFSCSHDISRLVQKEEHLKPMELYLATILLLPGVPFIYYGDEIGMSYIDGLKSIEGGYGRCGSRTPMQWDIDKNAGFSNAETNKLYLPVDTASNAVNVSDQENKDNSLLNKVKQIISIKRSCPAFNAHSKCELIETKDKEKSFAFIRESGDEKYLVFINAGKEKTTFEYDIKEEKCEAVLSSSLLQEDNSINFPLSVEAESYIIIKF